MQESLLMPLIVAIRNFKEGKVNHIILNSQNETALEYLNRKRELGRKILHDNFGDDTMYYIFALAMGLDEPLNEVEKGFALAIAEMIIGTLEDAALSKPYYEVEVKPK